MPIHAVYQSFIPILLLQVLCFALFFLIVKLVFKQKGLISACAAAVVAVAAAWSTVIFGFFGHLDDSARLCLFISLGIGVVCAIVLLWKFLMWLGSDVSSAATVTTAERARILKMTEEGKITVDESRELLDALGRSSALRGQEKFSRQDILVLAGVALVALGFFLPWSTFRMPNIPGPFGNVSAYVAGYHTGAIGWAVLIIAVLSAVPVFVTPKDLLYKISMLQIFLLLLGMVLVISMLVRAGGNLGAGLPVCLVGFVLAIAASAAKFRKLAA